MRLAGKGGQGMILAGRILAEAVALYDGRNAVQTQDYGPEARGGASKSEVIISDGEIYYPKVMNADLLVCMSQEASDRYYYDLKRDGLLIIDSTNVERSPTTRVVAVPITELAVKATGREITAAMVALGLICGLTKIVSEESLEKAIRSLVPKGTEELNVKAMRAGLEEAKRLLEAGLPVALPTEL
ncbi:MAG: 2-oxoacid:acceptor oxidoreductase family protein [Anaerolineae bacterium]|nr:2-oxoacid:acceptor oxidoreductase family protein [Anaerolineae bacterium]